MAVWMHVLIVAARSTYMYMFANMGALRERAVHVCRDATMYIFDTLSLDNG
jgi:hypothetical protein